VAPLRSSDRRKTADKIIQDFHVEIPKSPDTPDDKDGIPESANQPTLASIRNALLPENTQSAKFTTTAGPDLKVVSGTVYIGSYTGDDQRILWYRIDEQMYPTGKSRWPGAEGKPANMRTVYTLWRNPGLVPLLHTPDFVVHEKLQTGADLMTPGLAGPPFPSRATKGSLVAVASLQKPTVPLVVGSCEIDIASLKTARGEKGRAVRVLHWQGDELWSWSIAGRGGAFPPDHIDGWDQKAPEQLVEVQEGLDELDLKAEEDGGVALTKADIDTSSSAAPDKGTGSEEHQLLETSSVEDAPLTTKGTLHMRLTPDLRLTFGNRDR
jgi:translation initiation factor 2D